MPNQSTSPLRTRLERATKTAREGPERLSDTARRTLANRRDLQEFVDTKSVAPLRYFREITGTTPGKYFVLTTVLAILCGLVGWFCSYAIDNRTSNLKHSLTVTEPAAESSQVLYSSLSIADANANAAFISGGLESLVIRQKFNNALATAATALVSSISRSANNQDSSKTQAQQRNLETLAQQIPTYASLIESARVNNRLGNPVATAYLGEASHLMQKTILPAAESLYRERYQAIDNPERNIGYQIWLVYAALILLALAISVMNYYVSRHSNRLINIGLTIGAGLTVVALLWALIGGLLSISKAQRAQDQGAQPLTLLTSARIVTQQARSAETLGLVRRANDAELTQSFSSLSSQIRSLLNKHAESNAQKQSDSSVTKAIAALERWDYVHKQIVERTSAGDFGGATLIAVGEIPTGVSNAYADVDEALTEAITLTRKSFRDDINGSQDTLGFAGTGILIFCLIAGLAVIAGMTPRIREYR